MKSRKKRMLCLGIFLILMMLVTGCTSKNESSTKVGNDIHSTGKSDSSNAENVKQENKIYSIIQIDTERQLVRLQNIKNGKISEYGYSNGTEFRDKYGDLIGVQNMMPGKIVTIGQVNDSGNVSMLQISDEAWEQENVKKFEIQQEKQVIIIGKTKYYYDESLLVFLDAAQITLDEITSNDILRVAGIDKKIVSVSVTSGHGFLTFTNTDLFEGGWVSIGNQAVLKVTKDMKIELPKGTYLLSAANDGYGDSKEITITENETTTVNLEEYKGEGLKYCQLTFEVKPEGAVLTINGETVDYSNPIELKYGIYQIGIAAEGYDSFSEKLVVSSKEATISIDIVAMEEAEEEEEESTTSTGSTLSSGTTSSSRSSLSSGTSSTGKNTSSEEESSTYKTISDLLSTLLD